jgi:hypothetical protein
MLVVAVALFAGVVYALTELIVPGQVNIVAATNDIKICSDNTYSFELQKIIWSDLPVGGERCKTVFIKNLGNTDAHVVAILQGAPSQISLKVGADSIDIERGDKAPFPLYLEASPTANIESASFTVTFTSTPIYKNLQQ